jgi:hypothetical protein
MIKKVILFSSISTLILSSCVNSNDKKDKEPTSAYAAGNENDKELQKELERIQKEEEATRKEELAKLTTLSFNEMEHDYGTVKQESENVTYFIVTNTGKKPLIIEKVEASCGCTTPEKPEAPILPGKSDKIKVVFKPKPGQTGEQHKTVTVTANTEPKLTVLNIKAFVK